MNTMNTLQFISLLVAIVGCQLGSLYYLSTRIDRVSDTLTGRIDRVSDDMKQFYKTLGEHEGRLDGIDRRIS